MSMSLVAAPGIVMVLQEPVNTGLTLLPIDSASVAYLTPLLVSGAWMYLRARVGNSVEVMKATELSGSNLVVTRSIENTSPLTFAAGQTLENYMGYSAIEDLIAAAALTPALSLTSSDGSVTVTNTGPSAYNLQAAIPTLQSEDGSIVISVTGNVNDLSVNQSTIGCCTS
jgi:hypothetical protein